MANNLWKFQTDSIKIKAWVTHEKVEYLRNKEICAGLNFIGINLKFSQIVDNYVLGTLETGEVQLPGLQSTWESWLPGFLSTGESLYFSGEFSRNKEIFAGLNFIAINFYRL